MLLCSAESVYLFDGRGSENQIEITGEVDISELDELIITNVSIMIIIV